MSEVSYVLTMNSEQAREAERAVELLMRLKLGQYEELPFMLIDISNKDFCERRDNANMFLRQAFKYLLEKEIVKDDQWYRLYNLFQVLRHAIWEAECNDKTSWCKAADEPMRFTDEPLPKIEIVR